MAKKKKRNRSVSMGVASDSPNAAETSTPESRPRTAVPARDGEPGRRARSTAKAPPPPPASSGMWVPAVLGVALLIAVFYYFRGRNRTPAEPAGVQQPTDSTTPSTDSGARRPADRGDRPREGAGGSANAEPQRQPFRVERNDREVPAQGTPQNVAQIPTHRTPTSPDPRGGHFSLTDATAGMPSGTRLLAEIDTSQGVFTCDLWPDRAPNTVANFVGLARGTRDFWDPMAGRWARRPYFDGTVFHRVIPDFMIQGGDILRSGQGGPGYEIPDENTATHDQAGLLCMANHGPGTNGSQFFILEDPAAHLNNSYSVFGRCTPTDLVERIARVPSAGSTPLTPVYIQHVRIHR